MDNLLQVRGMKVDGEGGVESDHTLGLENEVSPRFL